MLRNPDALVMNDLAPRRLAALVLLTVLCVPSLASGQVRSAAASSSDSIAAVRIAAAQGERIVLDGLLNEPLWSRAQRIDDFRQREPLEGAPATEKTEVRLAYDDEALYVGVHARDSQPERIVARLLQRDRVMSRNDFGGVNFEGDDGVAILIDPFHDHRSAFVFATNANGAEYDALISDEGNQFNVDWRGVWRVASTRTADGWSTEFAIPWRTLRYPPEATGRVWGLNVFRVIQSRKEQVLWRSWDREGGGFDRVSEAGHLTGLDGLPRSGLNIEAKPFALAGGTQVRDASGGQPRAGEVNFGLDLKSELRPGLVLDLTANTDFAQVEVDDEQVNLTRFSLFFPEKRDFFLENAGIFEFGRQGFFGAPPYLMFVSRNIGIGPEGEVPILGGGRLTGRVGAQTVGVLSVVTDASAGRAVEVFNVARIKRDVGGSNYLGAMVTDRRGEGPANTVAGVDGRFYLSPVLVLDGFASHSFTEGDGGNDVAYAASLDYTTDPYGFYAEHFAVGRDAVATSGFITRADIRKSSLHGRRRIRPDFAGLRLNDFRISTEYQSAVDGRFQDWSAGASVLPTWNSGDNGSLGFTAGETRVDQDFALADSVPVPAGRYRTDQLRANFTSSPSRPWILGANLSRSDFFGGELLNMGGSLTITPAPALSISASFTRNDVDLPNGSFTADITGLRLIWALSTKVTTNALIQYNSLTDDFISNVRFNFIYRPGSDLFLVFTEERGVDDDRWALADRGMVLKFTYLVRF